MALSEELGTRQGAARPAAALRVGQAVGQAVGAGLTRFGLERARLALPVVLYLTAVILPVHFNLGPLYMNGVRLLLIVLIIPLTLNLLAGKYGRLMLIDVLFFAHIFWAMIALAVNNPQQVVTNAGSTGIEFLGGYMMGRAYIRDRGDFVALCRWLVVIVIGLSPFVLYEVVTGAPMIIRTINALPGISSFSDVNIGRRMGMDRVQTVFAHPIHSGLFFSTVFGLTFVGLNGTFGVVARWLVAILAGVCAFMALSSGALLAMVMLMGLIAWAQVLHKVRRKWMILTALLAVTYVVIDVLSNRTPLMVFLSYATFSPHTAYMRSIILDWGLINVWANPIFGLGLNDWVRPRYLFSGSMDNFWLVNAVRYGIPGFALLAGGYLLALVRIGRRDLDGDPVLLNLRRAWMFCMIGLAFTITTVHVWHTIYSFVFFIFGTGMWLLTVQPQQAGSASASQHAPAASAGPPPLGGTRTQPVRRSGVPLERTASTAPERAPPQTRVETAPRRSGPANSAPRADLRYSRFPVRPPARD